MPRNERNLGTIISSLVHPSEQADVQKEISKEVGKDIQTLIREKQQALKEKKAAKVKQGKDKLEKEKKQASDKKNRKKLSKLAKKTTKDSSKKTISKFVHKSVKAAGKSSMFASSKAKDTKNSAKSQQASKQSTSAKKPGKPAGSFFGAKGSLGSSSGDQVSSTLQKQAGNEAAVIQSQQGGQAGH